MELEPCYWFLMDYSFNLAPGLGYFFTSYLWYRSLRRIAEQSAKSERREDKTFALYHSHFWAAFWKGNGFSLLELENTSRLGLGQTQFLASL